jgi:hypothetical protein
MGHANHAKKNLITTGFITFFCGCILENGRFLLAVFVETQLRDVISNAVRDLVASDRSWLKIDGNYQNDILSATGAWV